MEIKIEMWYTTTLYKPDAFRNNKIAKIAKYKLYIVALQEIRRFENGNMQAKNAIVFYINTKYNKHEKLINFMVDNIIF